MFTWKTQCGLKFYFGQFGRSEICTKVSFTKPEVMWTLIMKLPHTEVKFYPKVKSQTGLSSLRVSCERALRLLKSVISLKYLFLLIQQTCYWSFNESCVVFLVHGTILKQWCSPCSASLQSVSKYYETFRCFTKFSFRCKWNDVRLLLTNMVYTSCLRSCRTT